MSRMADDVSEFAGFLCRDVVDQVDIHLHALA
jgi:hypothetical protein